MGSYYIREKNGEKNVRKSCELVRVKCVWSQAMSELLRTVNKGTLNKTASPIRSTIRLGSGNREGVGEEGGGELEI